MNFTVAISDQGTPAIDAVHARLVSEEHRKGLMEVIGRAAEIELKAWWLRRDAENPNKQGWPRRHFWLRIRDAAVYDASRTTVTSATVVVSDPALAAKVNGATIKPKRPGGALALPMNAEAYATGSPGSPAHSRIPGLFVYRSTEANGAFLVRKDDQGGLTFFYRLLKSVTVPKDPQALPPLDPLGAVLGQIARDYYALTNGGLN